MNRQTLPRGLRNCNPGNIRSSRSTYQGEVVPSQDPAFRQFRSLDWGYRAIFVLLDTYQTRHGLQTIAQMISRWAPSSENRTDLYIRTVCQRTGIPADRPLDTHDRGSMIPVAAAISFVENGVAADMTEVERGWELFVNS